MRIKFATRSAALFAALLASLPFCLPAAAAAPVVVAYVDNVTESPDGGSLANTTTVSLIGVRNVAGWKLTADVAYKAMRGSVPSAAEQRRSGQTVRSVRQGATYKSFGLTDVRISAERSVRLAGKLKLDLLARATLPSGKRGTARARGRIEGMLDVGLSTRVGRADVWTGAARKFRTAGFETPGRDINEVYAGLSVPAGKRTTLRADYLLAQSPWKGKPKESSISVSASHELDSGLAIDLYGSHFRDSYGKGNQFGLSLRVPLVQI